MQLPLARCWSVESGQFLAFVQLPLARCWSVESGYFLRFVQLPLARCWSVESGHFLAFVQLASFVLVMEEEEEEEEEEEPTSTGLAALPEKDYAAAEWCWWRNKKKWLQKCPWSRAARHPGGRIA